MGWEGRRRPLPWPLSPLCLRGKGREGAPPYPPECKQQQMNKNKNTKGRRKVPGIPPPLGSSLSPVEVPSLPPSTTAASVLGAAWRRPHPRGQSPGLKTAGPAAHTSDGRRVPCWCAGSAGTSGWGTWRHRLREEEEETESPGAGGGGGGGGGGYREIRDKKDNGIRKMTEGARGRNKNNTGGKG